MDEVTAGLQAMRQALTALAAAPAGAASDAVRVDRIRALEELRSAVAAAQAVETAGFVSSQRAAQAAAGVPAKRRGQGIAKQVGFAKRTSTNHGQRFVSWAMFGPSELPATFAELAAGRTTEWRAMLVARETACLSPADRAAVDAELAPRLEGLSDRQVEAEAKRAAYRLDPQAVVDRSRNAVSERRVTVRPAPDTMAWLTALLPVTEAVACYAELRRAADTARATGEPRSQGQVMADTLVERVTGQAAADAVPVEIQLVMTDQTLLSAGPQSDEPALLAGYGPIPAEIARDLAYRGGQSPSGDARTAPRWLRRLYVRPDDGQLVGMESHRRVFTEAQQRFMITRDHACRDPWCDAAARHGGHVESWVDGGATSLTNSRSQCEAGNYAEQAPGWRSRAEADGTIVTTTPTGHTYRSRPPELPRTRACAPPGEQARRERPPRFRIRHDRRPVVDLVYVHHHAA